MALTSLLFDHFYKEKSVHSVDVEQSLMNTKMQRVKGMSECYVHDKVSERHRMALISGVLCQDVLRSPLPEH